MTCASAELQLRISEKCNGGHNSSYKDGMKLGLSDSPLGCEPGPQ